LFNIAPAGALSSMTSAAPLPRVAHLKVLSAGAVKYVVTGFAPKFTRDTGDEVEFTFGTIGVVQQRLEDGETADIVIGTAPAIAQLEQAGLLVAGSRTELGRTLTGICVRAATPPPDISSPDRFRHAMLAARSVAYTDPRAGGTSGIFLVGLLGRLGIAEAVGTKALLCINGDEVVDKVLAGDAELGSTFISEIVPVRGVKVVGPLPAAIQNATAYAAGVMAGSSHRDAAASFIAMLTAPAQRDAWIALGFEPAGQG
jgi:molybdate transport system substrate-binding protein